MTIDQGRVKSFPSSFHSVLRGSALIACAASLHAAPPVVSGVDLRGLQIGKPTTLVITGTDLLPNPRILTTARIAKQTLKDGAKPDRIALEIELAPGSQPGLENWWLVTDNGVSARSVLATDAMLQTVFAEKIASLPAALHGTLTASQVREVTFPGKAGQEIICEIEAQRIESKLRPVLKLYGPGNTLLKWSLPQTALRGDTRFEVKLPADGDYRVTVNDLQFTAAAPAHFRLKIGKWSYADLAFPSTVQRGTSAEVQLVGRDGETRTVRLPSNAEGRAVPAPWADAATSSGPQPAVWLSDLPELVEQRTGSAPQALPALPVAVNGRISAPGESDAYDITVQPETEVELQVFADSLGSPIDAELELLDAKGARLAINDDDGKSPDPRLIYKVPKEVTKLTAVVHDVNGNGGPHCIYRLQATVRAGTKPADFSLAMIEDSHTLQPGRAGVIKVEAKRDGYDGPIDLQFEHLPDGVKVSGQKIPAQATATLVTLSSDKPVTAVIAALKGRGKDREVPAAFESAQLGKFQPWLENDLALASAAKPEVQFDAAWGKAADVKKIPLAGKLTLPVTCGRTPGHDGPVRLTLLTSQARQFTNNAVDATKMLREEKAMLIEEDKKTQQAFDAVTAAETALAAAEKAITAAKDDAAKDAAEKKKEAAQTTLEKTPQALTAAAKEMKNDVEFVLLVPAELPEIPHQIAFKAELLKRDRRTVEAVAYTPVREVPVVNPLVLKLNPPAPAKLDARAGASLELTGTVERIEGATGDVTLTLAGLPSGVTATPASVVVKASEKQFKFALKVPANFKPGDFPGLKISGTGRPFGGNLNVRTRDMEVTMKVLPPDPPAEPKPAAKPAAAPAVAPDAKPAAKPDAKPDAKADPKPNPKACSALSTELGFWAKGPAQASPGQARHERRPGSCIQNGQSPERATHVVTPFQGFVSFLRFPQGVALGWLASGLWPAEPPSPEVPNRISTVT